MKKVKGIVMKLSDFTTLAEAQAYTITIDTKQVGSGQARGYLVNNNDLWKALKVIQSDITHQLFSLADAIITTASDAQSYFGMDITKADGVANRAGVDILVQAQIMTQDEADGFIAMTLSVTTPFKNSTQIELDTAKAEALLYVDTPPLKIGYPQLDSEMDYAVVLANKQTQFRAVLASPAVVDTRIDIYAHADPSDDKTFEITGKKVGYINILKGETYNEVTINKFLSRYIQASAISNVACDYNLICKAL